MKLHGSRGPAYTTVSDVAKEAGVQRATVYRHFPTQEDLFAACSGHFIATNPPPGLEGWGEASDPARRLRTALAELYRYYERTEYMFEKTTRDADVVPAMQGPVEAGKAYRAMAADLLMRGRSERGSARRRARAALGHALEFLTWRSLVRQQGLSEGEAVAVAVAMVENAGAARPSSARA
jgi:AcrR family transcriptional regulator